jgi:hypothetical protein
MVGSNPVLTQQDAHGPPRKTYPRKGKNCRKITSRVAEVNTAG